MKKKITISVGIPAHNEEKNIASLLQSIVRQKEKKYSLKEIIVIADGCTDATVEKVHAIKDKRIKLVNDKKRLGKSARMNNIIRLFSGDILVLLDADITIKDIDFFDTFISSVNFSRSGVASPNYKPLPARNFFEQCLQISLDVQDELRRKWNKGRNYLSFKGALMAVDGKFAKSLKIPKSLVNNDAYIYFRALEKKYKPAFISDVYIYYKTPMNFADHLAQSSRYQASEGELSKYIAIEEEEYKIPTSLYLSTAVKYLFLHPLLMTGYITIRIASKFLKKKQLNSVWRIAVSTKLLH